MRTPFMCRREGTAPFRGGARGAWLVAAVAACSMMSVAHAQTLPVNPQGDVTSYNTDATTGTLTTSQRYSTVEWDSFSVSSGQTFAINQAVDGAVLNVVTGGGGQSQIVGTIRADEGSVFLVNPGGIVFGDWSTGATVQVPNGSFVASTLPLTTGTLEDYFENGGSLTFEEITPQGSTLQISNHSQFVVGRDLFLLSEAINIAYEGGDVQAGRHIGLATVYKGSVTLLPFNATDPSGMRLAIVANDLSGGDVSSQGFGIDIQGGNTLRGALVEAVAQGDAYGLAINHMGVIEAKGTETTPEGRVFLRSVGGNVQAPAGTVAFNADGRVTAENYDGSGGGIAVQADTLNLPSSSTFPAFTAKSTGTSGNKDGGSIHLDVMNYPGMPTDMFLAHFDVSGFDAGAQGWVRLDSSLSTTTHEVTSGSTFETEDGVRIKIPVDFLTGLLDRGVSVAITTMNSVEVTTAVEYAGPGQFVLMAGGNIQIAGSILNNDASSSSGHIRLIAGWDGVTGFDQGGAAFAMPTAWANPWDLGASDIVKMLDAAETETYSAAWFNASTASALVIGGTDPITIGSFKGDVFLAAPTIGVGADRHVRIGYAIAGSDLTGLTAAVHPGNIGLFATSEIIIQTGYMYSPSGGNIHIGHGGYTYTSGSTTCMAVDASSSAISLASVSGMTITSVFQGDEGDSGYSIQVGHGGYFEATDANSTFNVTANEAPIVVATRVADLTLESTTAGERPNNFLSGSATVGHGGSIRMSSATPFTFSPTVTATSSPIHYGYYPTNVVITAGTSSALVGHHLFVHDGGSVASTVAPYMNVTESMIITRLSSGSTQIKAYDQPYFDAIQSTQGTWRSLAGLGHTMRLATSPSGKVQLADGKDVLIDAKNAVVFTDNGNNMSLIAHENGSVFAGHHVDITTGSLGDSSGFALMNVNGALVFMANRNPSGVLTQGRERTGVVSVGHGGVISTASGIAEAQLADSLFIDSTSPHQVSVAFGGGFLFNGLPSASSDADATDTMDAAYGYTRVGTGVVLENRSDSTRTWHTGGELGLESLYGNICLDTGYLSEKHVAHRFVAGAGRKIVIKYYIDDFGDTFQVLADPHNDASATTATRIVATPKSISLDGLALYADTLLIAGWDGASGTSGGQILPGNFATVTAGESAPSFTITGEITLHNGASLVVRAPGTITVNNTIRQAIVDTPYGDLALVAGYNVKFGQDAQIVLDDSDYEGSDPLNARILISAGHAVDLSADPTVDTDLLPSSDASWYVWIGQPTSADASNAPGWLAGTTIHRTYGIGNSPTINYSGSGLLSGLDSATPGLLLNATQPQIVVTVKDVSVVYGNTVLSGMDATPYTTGTVTGDLVFGETAETLLANAGIAVMVYKNDAHATPNAVYNVADTGCSLEVTFTASSTALSHAAILSTAGTLTVTARPVTVTVANPYERSYGDNNNPTWKELLDGGYVGLVGDYNDTISGNDPASAGYGFINGSGEAVTASTGVGTYALRLASDAFGANFNITVADGGANALTINRRSLTVTGVSGLLEYTYGSATATANTLDFTTTGAYGTDDVNTLLRALAAESASDATRNAGLYNLAFPVDANLGANYVLASFTGGTDTVRVNRRAVNIALTDGFLNYVYGDTTVTNTLTITNDDTLGTAGLDALIASAVAASDSNVGRNAGTYNLTGPATGTALGTNYAVGTVTGGTNRVVVGRRAVDITLADGLLHYIYGDTAATSTLEFLHNDTLGTVGLDALIADAIAASDSNAGRNAGTYNLTGPSTGTALGINYAVGSVTGGTGRVVVDRRTVNIRFDGGFLSYVYGDATAMNTLTITNDDTLGTVGLDALIASAVTASDSNAGRNAGTYNLTGPSTGTALGANYTVGTVSGGTGRVVVGRRTVNIALNDGLLHYVYGDTTATNTLAITNDDTLGTAGLDALIANAVVGSDSNAGRDAGTYNLTGPAVGTALGTNYAVGTVSGGASRVIVDRRTVDITLADGLLHYVYGDTAATSTLEFLHNDTLGTAGLDALIADAVAASDSNVGRNAGTYNLTGPSAGTALGNNYAVGSVSGGANRIVVDRRTVNIALNGGLLSYVYGDTAATNTLVIAHDDPLGTAGLDALIASAVAASDSNAGRNAGTYNLAGPATGTALGANYAVGTVSGGANRVFVDRRTVSVTVTDGLLHYVYGDSAATANTLDVTLGNALASDDDLNAQVLAVLAASDSNAGRNAGTYNLAGPSAGTALGDNYRVGAFSGGANRVFVDRRGLRITVRDRDASSVYGDAPPLLGRDDLDIDSGGFDLGDAGSGAAMYVDADGRAVDTRTGVGNYAADIGTLDFGANYRIDAFDGSRAILTITPRTLHIGVDALTRHYGDANPLLTWSYREGSHTLVNGDQPTGALATDANVRSWVGTYAVTAGTLDFGPNYHVAGGIASNSLTVTARPVTVEADPVSRLFGMENPPLTWTITRGSLANGDEASGELATDANAQSPVGLYDIDRHTLLFGENEGRNYDVNFVGGQRFAVRSVEEGNNSDPTDTLPDNVSGNNGNGQAGDTTTPGSTEVLTQWIEELDKTLDELGGPRLGGGDSEGTGTLGGAPGTGGTVTGGAGGPENANDPQNGPVNGTSGATGVPNPSDPGFAGWAYAMRAALRPEEEAAENAAHPIDILDRFRLPENASLNEQAARATLGLRESLSIIQHVFQNADQVMATLSVDEKTSAHALFGELFASVTTEAASAMAMVRRLQPLLAEQDAGHSVSALRAEGIARGLDKVNDRLWVAAARIAQAVRTLAASKVTGQAVDVDQLRDTSNVAGVRMAGWLAENRLRRDAIYHTRVERRLESIGTK